MAALTPQTILNCSSEELFTLAAILGSETLIGVPDPFPGWLTEEVETAVNKAREDLIRRGYLQEQNGVLQMDVLVAALVAAVAEPDAIVILTAHWPPQMPQQEAFYWRPPLIVHLRHEEETLHLTALSSAEEIPFLVRKAWELEIQQPVQAQGFVVLQEALDTVREALGQGEQKAIRVLYRSGVEAGDARAFVRTLQTGTRNGALLALRPLENTWQVSGIGMLEGENGLWRLRPFQRQNTEWVECTPCSAVELTEEVHSFLERFFPLGD